MNYKSTKTISALSLALAAGISSSLAGVDAPETALPTAAPAFTGEISAGWDSQYFFRGLWFGDETVWTNISISKEIAPNLTGSVNAFYTDVMDNDLAYSEANLGATLSYDAGFGTFDLGFLYYRFFDGFGGDNNGLPVAGNRDATELSLTYSQELFYGINGHLLAAYDLRIDGGYLEAGLSKSWKLSDKVGLDVSVATGYSLGDYYSQGLSAGLGLAIEPSDGFTHTLVSVAAPIALTDTVTFTPHVSCNFSHEARDGINGSVDRDGSEVFYGAALSVSF